MHHLSKQLPGFSNLPYQVSGNADFLNWVESVNPEHSVPECWDTESELSMNSVHMHTYNSCSVFTATVVNNADTVHVHVFA